LIYKNLLACNIPKGIKRCKNIPAKMYEIDDIKRVRKKLNLTQGELANRAQVSQSLIAKIEAKRLDPTYTKVKQIFAALEQLEQKGQLTAAQLMNNKVISIEANAQLKDTISTMKKHQISQMPVMEHGHIVGLISESTILDALIEGKHPHVKDIMADTPPLVPKNASVNMVSSLLRHCPMVVVAEQGKAVGVITKSDLIGKAYKA
jgi:predicted transcriptional regulator